MKFLLAIVAAIIIMIVYAIIDNKTKNKYSTMSDERLIELYKECANNIDALASGGSGLKGAFSTAATNSINNKIQEYRNKGEMIGDILVSRGYKVDFSVLNATATKGKSDISKSVIGSAIVGGMIAGSTGAIVGAINAANNNKKD